MAVKLSRKCGCKRKTRNKQTKRGKTMKGGARGPRPGHSGSVRSMRGSMSGSMGTFNSQKYGSPQEQSFGTQYRFLFDQNRTAQPNIIAPPAYMPPPAYTPETLNRQKSKIPTPSTFTVVAPNVLSPIEHKPTGVPSFTSSMGTTYYLPEK